MIPFSPGPPDEPVPGAAGATVTDDRLLRRAAVCLLAVLGRRGYEITVRVQNGVVMLCGSVVTEELRLLAHRIAWSVPDVRDVSNRLVVDANR
ncbi:BON domain-containing protein [Actinoplanes sp. NPDC051411]|uniref:BON domain-containing protein n=1 Tax=Actinoplanes sp. NPDC051411 TaxID=3155522 RepID=UPI00341D1AB7